MKYTFKDMLTTEVYETAYVMFILGKYNIFNNMASDTMKGFCVQEDSTAISADLLGDFGLDAGDEDDIANSVDFATFMAVNGVANINGRWFCRVDYSAMNKKQKEQLMKYIKNPSPNGVLVVVSNEWRDYKDLLKSKILMYSKNAHILELGFPHRDVLKGIVTQMFHEKNIIASSQAVDHFIQRMSAAYDEYEQVIDDIADKHSLKMQEDGGSRLELKEIKEYMKGIEHYVLDDFVAELTKPMSSDKTNSKKILKILMILEDEYGAKDLVYRLLSIIQEYIDFRILINEGYIPISINYFFNDVVKTLDPDSKYAKMKEYTFRKKAIIASQTSLRDWEYMKLILFNAIKNKMVTEEVMDQKCQRALYELCTRSVITADRINNIIGIDNVLVKQRQSIDKYVFDDSKLEELNNQIKLANTEGEQYEQEEDTDETFDIDDITIKDE